MRKYVNFIDSLFYFLLSIFLVGLLIASLSSRLNFVEIGKFYYHKFCSRTTAADLSSLVGEELYLELLDESVYKRFKNDGGTILLIEDAPTDCTGSYTQSTNTINLYGAGSLSAIPLSTYTHEFSHYVDAFIINYSVNSKFRILADEYGCELAKYYVLDGDNYLTQALTIGDYSEVFAILYGDYLAYPDRLKDCCPELYCGMEQIHLSVLETVEL